MYCSLFEFVYAKYGIDATHDLLDRIGNEIGVLDLWDYSHQNGRKINRLDMSSNYNDRKVYYHSWAEEIMKSRHSNKNAMLLNYFSNVILQALTTLELRLTPLTARFPISDRSCGADS